MKFKPEQGGFTLIEIMVAVSLFIVVAFITTSAFTSFTEASRRSQAIRNNIDNLNFAMESIVLKIREGNNYSCLEDDDVAAGVTHDCPTAPSQTIAFLADNGDVVKYKFAQDASGGTILKSENGSAFEPIVATQVNVSRLDFYVKNGERPLARIVIQGSVTTAAGASEFTLQTTISQRP